MTAEISMSGPRQHVHEVEVLFSVASPKAIATLVERVWDVRVSSCKLLHHSVNDLYDVRCNGDRRIFRLYGSERGDEDTIGYELALAGHLAARGAAVSHPIHTQNGSTSLLVDGPEGHRVGSLWTEAPGRDTTYDDADLYGRWLATLHTAADGFADRGRRRPLDGGYLIESRLDAIESLLWEHPAEWSWFADHARRVAERLHAVPTVDVGPCHGDTHGSNANVADGVVTFYDTEFCGPGPRVYDLATYRWGMAFNRQPPDQGWEQFLEGYSAVRSIDERDLAAVEVFVAARNTWLLGHWASAESVEPGHAEHPWRWIERVLGIARDFAPAL